MPGSLYITRFLSGLLIVVFALGITPKRYLHNIFAKHIDNCCKQAGDSAYQLTASGYNCDNDNQVAESSFVNAQHAASCPVFPLFSFYILTNTSSPSASGVYSQLRGPPVNI